MLKDKNDLVKLVNLNKEKGMAFAYDSVWYTVPAGGSVKIRRELADHGVKKTHIYGERKHQMKIEELPESQRNSQVIEVAAETVELQKQNSQLANENEALREQIAKLSKKEEGEVPAEHRKPGRPKSK